MANTGWCAKIRISGGYIVRAELIYRQYTVLSETLSPFSEDMAVIAAGQKGGGEPVLVYDDAFGSVSCKWILNTSGEE